MSKLPFFVSATFVLIFAAAEPIAASPQKQAPSAPSEESPWPDTPLSDDLSVAQPPQSRATQQTPDARYYPYHQALTFRLGQVADIGDLNSRDMLIGFQYQFPRFLSPKIEAGADLHNDGK